MRTPISRLNLLCLVLLACLVFASNASASDFNRFGPYVSVNGIYALPLFEDNLQDLNSGLSVDGSGGLSARLGLRLLSFLAVEGQYEWVEGFDVDLSGTGHIASFSSNNLLGNLRFHIPVWRVDPYILAGIGVSWWKIEDGAAAPVSFEDDGAGFAGRLGGGVDFYITKHIVLNAEAAVMLTTREFDIPNSIQSLDNLYYLSIGAGLAYRF